MHTGQAEARSRAQALAPRLVGLSEADARALVASERCLMRIAGRDGDGFPLTMDYRPNRITVVVADGRIVEADARG